MSEIPAFCKSAPLILNTPLLSTLNLYQSPSAITDSSANENSEGASFSLLFSKSISKLKEVSKLKAFNIEFFLIGINSIRAIFSDPTLLKVVLTCISSKIFLKTG